MWNFRGVYTTLAAIQQFCFCSGYGPCSQQLSRDRLYAKKNKASCPLEEMFATPMPGDSMTHDFECSNVNGHSVYPLTHIMGSPVGCQTQMPVTYEMARLRQRCKEDHYYLANRKLWRMSDIVSSSLFCCAEVSVFIGGSEMFGLVADVLVLNSKQRPL